METENQTPPRLRHLTSWHLDLQRIGADTGLDPAWMQAHTASCPSCAQLVATLEGARQEFGGFAARSAAQLRQRRQRDRRRRITAWLLGGLLVPATVLVLLFVIPRGPRSFESAPGGDSQLGIKGGPSVVIAVRRGARIFRAAPDAPLRAGDQVRFVLDDVSEPFVMIGSVDGAGHANLYVPYDGAASLAIAPAPHIEIPGSIIIDDSPGPERLFFLFSPTALDGAMVRNALARLAAGGVGALRARRTLDIAGTRQLSVLLEKERP